MKQVIKIYFWLLLAVGAAACGDRHAHDTGEPGTTYTCPMHPQIIQSKPGDCPVCGMALVPVTKTQNQTTQASVMLSDSQIKLGNITTQAVQTGTINNNTLLTGRLVTNETQTDLVSSRAAGRLEQLYVKEAGVTIRKGQPLYAIYSEELLTLEREYLLSLEQQQSYGAQDTRLANLVEAARKKLLLSGLTAGQIQKLGRTQRPAGRLTFLSPATGVITEVVAAEGTYVPEGGLLYRVSRLGKIWVEAELYPAEAPGVKTGQAIQVNIPGLPSMASKIAFINPEFRQQSQVIIVRAEVSNVGGQLLPGMPATITLPGTSPSGITLPNEAIIREAQGAHVWVKTGNSTFSARPVETGEAGAENTAITSGLSPTDTVVVSGAYLLYSEYVLKNGTDIHAGHTAHQ